jgi:hypothetical protein
MFSLLSLRDIFTYTNSDSLQLVDAKARQLVYIRMCFKNRPSVRGFSSLSRSLVTIYMYFIYHIIFLDLRNSSAGTYFLPEKLEIRAIAAPLSGLQAKPFSEKNCIMLLCDSTSILLLVTISRVLKGTTWTAEL